MSIVERRFYPLLRIIMYPPLIPTVIILAAIVLVFGICFVVFALIFFCPYFMLRKYILKDRINKANDLITNISSVIPSEDEVVRMNEKA